MPRADDIRASGMTGAGEAAQSETDKVLQGLDNQVEEERERTIGALSFSRMRLSWRPEDRAQMAQIRNTVDRVLLNHFADAYALMVDIFDIVREKEADSYGEVKTDNLGLPVYKRALTGGFVEDWTRLTTREKEHFLFRITTSQFSWKQARDDLWAESLFAKAMFTETFARSYDQGYSGTIEDRTARANSVAAEERYFAVYTAYLSRKADSIIQSLDFLALRIRDTLHE